MFGSFVTACVIRGDADTNDVLVTKGSRSAASGDVEH
jgi:hypothetical protein